MPSSNGRLKRGLQQVRLKDLGRLHRPQGRPVQRLAPPCRPSRTALMVSFTGTAGAAAPQRAACSDHLVDELRRHQGAGAVLHRQQLHALPGLQCRQQHRVGPALPAPDHLGAFGDAVGPGTAGRSPAGPPPGRPPRSRPPAGPAAGPSASGPAPERRPAAAAACSRRPSGRSCLPPPPARRSEGGWASRHFFEKCHASDLPGFLLQQNVRGHVREHVIMARCLSTACSTRRSTSS